jgi:hypothetical protein
MASFNRPDRERKPGSIGVAVDGTEMQVVDEDDNEVPQGERGERGGYNVYPRELEELLYEHPAVGEAAVIGIPHESLGEEVAAVVALKNSAEATPDELRDYIKQRVAAYKYRRVAWFVDELPKGSTGKILKREIEAQIPAVRGWDGRPGGLIRTGGHGSPVPSLCRRLRSAALHERRPAVMGSLSSHARRPRPATSDKTGRKSAPSPADSLKESQLAAGRDLLRGVGRHRRPESKQQATKQHRAIIAPCRQRGRSSRSGSSGSAFNALACSCSGRMTPSAWLRKRKPLARCRLRSRRFPPSSRRQDSAGHGVRRGGLARAEQGSPAGMPRRTVLV